MGLGLEAEAAGKVHRLREKMTGTCGTGARGLGWTSLSPLPLVMKLRLDLRPLLCVLVGLVLSAPAHAQRPDRGTGGKAAGDIGPRAEPEAAGIAWFGTWDGALAEATRTGRPILLMSAAPACREVPGVW